MIRTPDWATAVACAVGLGWAVLTTPGCQSGPAQLLDTARLEEMQNNPQHARQLYEEIVRDYPASEQAQVARARLAQLGPQP